MNEEEQNQIHDKTQWEITTNRYIAYIDIMGFKDLVARTTHEAIYKMMKKIDHAKRFNASINWGDFNSNLITTTTYSDSLMIYSKDESFESLYSLICTVSSLVNDLFIEAIPFKGAFAFGMMTLDFNNSIFFGQPLIDAYLLQEEISFYGIVAHATAQEKIDSFKNANKVFPYITVFNCYFKNGNSKHLTIYPMYASPGFENNPKSKNYVDELFESINKLRYKTSGQLRKYIDNTEVYLNSIKNNKE
jgi:hypothetical protein